MINLEFYVIQAIETGEFMKKYQWTGYGSKKNWTSISQLNPHHFTPVLGRARVFESESKARQALPTWSGESSWEEHGLVRIVKCIASVV